MWCIVGTVPQANFPLTFAPYTVEKGQLHLAGLSIPVERGTAALAAAAWLTCEALGSHEKPHVLLAGDTGNGAGSRVVYAWLVQHLPEWEQLTGQPTPKGMTFHYLFPDVDWHNRVLLGIQVLARQPLLVADAGYMYVAKMSGYADAYDLFTPDVGEMAFMADESAPHPFYTRGFLLSSEDDIPNLVARAHSHANCPRNLIVKGAKDYVVQGQDIVCVVDSPSVEAMEAIGGTGDIITGLVTGMLACGMDMRAACEGAVRAGRQLAQHAQPTPATQVGALLQKEYFQQVLSSMPSKQR